MKSARLYVVRYRKPVFDFSEKDNADGVFLRFNQGYQEVTAYNASDAARQARIRSASFGAVIEVTSVEPR